MSDEITEAAAPERIDEFWLQRQIHKVWGEYGAHADIYREALKRCDLYVKRGEELAAAKAEIHAQRGKIIIQEERIKAETADRRTAEAEAARYRAALKRIKVIADTSDADPATFANLVAHECDTALSEQATDREEG